MRASIALTAVALVGASLLVRPPPPRATAAMPKPSQTAVSLQASRTERASQRWRGSVVGPDGRPLAGVDVTLGPADPCTLGAYTRLQSGADGTFEFDPPTRPSRLVAAHVAVEAVDGAVLRLSVPAFIEGYVSACATVSVTSGVRTVASTETDADGMYKLGPLPTGVLLTLHVDANGHLPWHERQRELREGESLYRVVRVEPGLALRGAVEPAVAGVTVRANQGDGRELVATTDGDGRFTIGGLTAGRVRLIALADGYETSMTTVDAGEWAGLTLKRRNP